MQFNQKDIEKLMGEHHFFGFLREWTLKYKSIQRLAWRMVMREKHSFYTFRRYVTGIKHFVNYLGVENPDQAIEKARKGDTTKIVDGFIAKLTKDGVKPITIKSTYYGVRKWLMSNNVKAEWEFIARPKAVSKIKDRIPTTEELRKILNFAHIRDKALFMTMLSSGLRVGTAMSLLVKDYERLEDLAIIHVEGGEGRKLSEGSWYWTFITPEARKVVDSYLEWRERVGEKLTPESALFSAVEKKGTPFRFATNISRQWRRLVEKANLDKMIEGTHWLDLHLHVLRKFFHTRTKGSGISRDFYDFWMGHTQPKGLADSYWREEIGKHLAEYKKAFPHLSIMEAATQNDQAIEMQLASLQVQMIGKTETEKREMLASWFEMLSPKTREIVKPRMVSYGLDVAFEKEKDCQKVITESQLEAYLEKGYRFVSILPSGKVVVED